MRRLAIAIAIACLTPAAGAAAGEGVSYAFPSATGSIATDGTVSGTLTGINLQWCHVEVTVEKFSFDGGHWVYWTSQGVNATVDPVTWNGTWSIDMGNLPWSIGFIPPGVPERIWAHVIVTVRSYEPGNQYTLQAWDEGWIYQGLYTPNVWMVRWPGGSDWGTIPKEGIFRGEYRESDFVQVEVYHVVGGWRDVGMMVEFNYAKGTWTQPYSLSQMGINPGAQVFVRVTARCSIGDSPECVKEYGPFQVVD